MEINIRIKFRNKEFEKSIKTDDKVSDLISHLFVRLHFQEKNMTLKYGQMYLLNDKTFQSIGIKENDLIEVIVKKYPVTVSYKDKVEFVDVNDNMTVKELKLLIAEIFKKDYSSINLEVDGQFLVNETAKLETFELNENCTITNINSREIKERNVIYVKIDTLRVKGKAYNAQIKYNSETVNMVVDDLMPVYELRLRVAEKFNIPYDTINLKYNKNELKYYNELLGKYDLIENCVFYNEDLFINVKNITASSVFRIKTRWDDGINQIKDKISEKTGINVEFQLHFNAQELENDKQILSYNIKNGDHIEMICKLVGGNH